MSLTVTNNANLANHTLHDIQPSQNFEIVEKEAALQNSEPKIGEALHKPEAQSNDKTKQENQEPKSKNILVDLVTDPTYRNTSIAALNALFHGLSAFTTFTNKGDPGKQNPFGEFCDKTAFFFTRWVAPLTSYAVAAVESVKHKKWIEAAIKAVPPLFLPLVGEANIDTVYGSSTGFNCPYDMVVKRLDEKAEKSSEFKQYVDQSSKSGMGHMKMFVAEFKNMIQDFIKGKLTFEDSTLLVACSSIVAGSLPIMLFMREARDSWAARLLGLMRNAGGVTGDLMFGIQGIKNKEHYKSLIGVFCTLAATSDVVKRWVSDSATVKILVHLGAALNVSGYAVWNAFSGSKKKADKVDLDLALAA